MEVNNSYKIKKFVVNRLENKYLKRKFIQGLKEIKDILNKMFKIYALDTGEARNLALQYDFDKMISFIREKENIKLMDNILNCYNRYNRYTNNNNKITSRKLYVTFIIASFPEYVLDFKRDKMNELKSGYEIHIFNLACKIVEYLHKFANKGIGLFDMELFTMYVNLYCRYYKIFIELDRIKKINELINMWCNTQETIIEVGKYKKYGEF